MTYLRRLLFESAVIGFDLMQRRTTKMSGCVNFPVHLPNSKEGGMFVKLVVCDNREGDSRFEQCCGAYVCDTFAESLVGDDRCPLPAHGPFESMEDIDNDSKRFEKWRARHYPNLEIKGVLDRYQSRDYLAAIVMGSTGWSGDWTCTLADLTEAGKDLYSKIAALYPGCDLHLLTFLDT
jgi:hypothetical protein